MAASNEDQIAYWNGPGGARWIEGRDRMERNLAAIWEALLATAAPRPGERVLDVGCGCGRTTAVLQQRTGAPAVGVDVSLPMLAYARQEERPDLPLRFVAGDASQLPFAPEHELVISRFGVMFFADPVAAFAHLRTALAPGGRLVFVCWRSLALNAWAQLPLAAARPLLPPQPPRDPDAPGPFALADGERLAGILASAGFTQVALEPLATTMYLGATLDDAAAEATTMGPLARLLGETAPETVAEIRARVRTVYEPFVTPRGVEPTAAVWLVTAR